ncbi:hypothetical protein ES708_19102 [subsurface metagenome]
MARITLAPLVTDIRGKLEDPGLNWMELKPPSILLKNWGAGNMSL